MQDPLNIRFSQDNIGQEFKDGTSIFDTYEKLCEGMKKSQIPMMRVVARAYGRLVTLDNRRLAVYKMARRAGKCYAVKVIEVARSDVNSELRRKSDSTVGGLSVRVRGTHKVIHADGSVTEGARLTDGQLQHRADTGGHWTSEQLQCIEQAVLDFETVIRGVLGSSATLSKAGSFMKGTDIAGESDVDLMAFGCGPINEDQWQGIVRGIKQHQRGYLIQSINPRCIHVEARSGCIRIEFDVVAHQRQGFPPNQVPTNPFKNNRAAAHAVRNIKMDFKESGEARFSGNDIENAVLAELGKLQSPGLGKLIDASKAALQHGIMQRRVRPRTGARENRASQSIADWATAAGEGQFRRVFKGRFTIGERVGQASATKVFKDGTQAFEDAYFSEDLAVVEKAIQIVDAFNKVKKFKHLVQVCKPEVWHQDDSKQRLLVEPFIAGFQKYNSNTSWVASTESAAIIESLLVPSHGRRDGVVRPSGRGRR